MNSEILTFLPNLIQFNLQFLGFGIKSGGFFAGEEFPIIGCETEANLTANWRLFKNKNDNFKSFVHLPNFWTIIKSQDLGGEVHICG